MEGEPEKPAHWPDGVYPLYIEEFQKLGRDKKNALFWDGKPLVTKNQYIFTGYQLFLSVLAVIASVATISTGINNTSIFLCGRGVKVLGCPVAAAPATIIVQVAPVGNAVKH